MKHILSAALLIASAAAHAQSSHWTFNYTGFYDREAAVFLPDMTLSGSFTGVDANQDGVLERGELTSLTIGEMDYVACGANSNATYHCGADSFQFSPDSGLSFSVGEYGGDPEGWVGSGHIVTTGDALYDYQFNPNTSTEHHLDWNQATTLSMVSVVPEPASFAMLAAGLAGIALVGRTRLTRRRA
jgi:predicted porin